MKNTSLIEENKNLTDGVEKEHKKGLIEKILAELDEIEASNRITSKRIKTDYSIKKLKERGKKRRKRKLQTSLMLIVGIGYLIIGLLVFLLGKLWFTGLMNSTNTLSIIFISAGVFMMIVVLVRIKLFGKNTHEKMEVSFYELISKWEEIKASMIKTMPDSEQKTIKEMIEPLYSNTVVSERETNDSLALLKAINRTVHNENSKISDNELRRLIASADKLISKFKQMIE